MNDLGFGLRTGVVANIADPDKLGRVEVRFPWLPGDRAGEKEGLVLWARLLTIGAGAERGLVSMPLVDDEVLVGFEGGELDRPFVLGGLWSKKAPPPEDATDGKGTARALVSQSGQVVRLSDVEGEEKIEIFGVDQKVAITLDCKTQAITITAEKDLTLESKSGKVTIKGKDIAIEASGETVVKGSKVKLN